MATSAFPLLVIVFLVGATVASARPCKTIFFFTSTSYYPIISENSNPNPNFPFQTLTHHQPRYLTFFFTSTSNFNANHNPRQFNNLVFEEPMEEYEEFRSLSSSSASSASSAASSAASASSMRSSIRYRAKDIMSVLGALLFGMGCGALTAATMYLIWSLFTPNRFEYDEDESDDDFDSGDDFSPKKMMKGGYVSIPGKVFDDDLKKPVAVAKEVV